MRKFLGVSLALVGVSLGFACGDDDDSSPIGGQNGRSGAGSSQGGSAGASGRGGGGPMGGSAGSSSGSAGASGAAGSSPTLPPPTLPAAFPEPPPVETCISTIPVAPEGNVCGVTGTGAQRVLRGRVVAPDKIYDGGEVVLDDKGVIACVGCDCSATPGYADPATTTTIACPSGVITPALINTHDHITFAHNTPKTHANKYNHRHEWRTGANGGVEIDVDSFTLPAEQGPRDDAVRWGEIRFVMGGAASTVGAGGVDGMLRNLDRNGTQQGGLDQKAVSFETFPLDDANGFLLTECKYNGSDVVPTASLAAEDAFLPHIAEGVSAPARNEFVCTRGYGGAQQDYLQTQTTIVHAIGVTAADAAVMGGQGTGAIWSPRSNIDLYGFTANVVQFARMGVTVALGTDWSASGSYNLLRELACADAYNTNNLGGIFKPYHLYRMVTEDAALLTASHDKIGSLKVGLFGDVTVWAGANQPDAYAAVTKANVQDVALVLRAGSVLYGESASVDALAPGGGVGCEVVSDGATGSVCGAARKVCAEREFGAGKTIAAMDANIKLASNGQLYPLFFCDAAAAGEPSCVPSRPGEFTGVSTPEDTDGDGKLNEADNCPTIFNPIRPMDGAAQPDADADGVGDACDPCPFRAGTDACPLVSEDTDADGVFDSYDDCPDVANPDQGDNDLDGKGNACDGCPDSANPGAALCPAADFTIAEAKTKTPGTLVTIRNVVVSAISVNGGNRGFWVQDAAAGIFVFTGGTSPTVVPGDRVDVGGSVAVFSGLIELEDSTVTKLSSGEPPAPVVVDPASISTTGADKDKYLGMLVSVQNVSITNANPDAPSDFDEMLVTGGLRVDDYIYNYDNASFAVGTTFAVITGPLSNRFADSKILPRSEADLTPAPPAVAGKRR